MLVRRIAYCTLFFFGAHGCDTAARGRSRQTGDAARTLDSLVTQLRTAGGEFITTSSPPVLAGAALHAEAFAAFRERALDRLVDCMSDTNHTSTKASSEAETATVPVGTLCYDVLTTLVAPVENVATIPGVVLSDLYVARGDTGRALIRGQAAWRVVVKSGGYWWRKQ